MLTRRGLAACALCAAAGFLATGAEPQNAPGGLKRTILKRIDGPTAGYETVSVRVEIDPSAVIAPTPIRGSNRATSSRARPS